MSEPRVPSRSLQYAAYLAVLFGIAGVLLGLLGALTFIPSRQLDNLDLSLAQALTAVSAAGAAVSVPGIVAGWGLLRMKGWAWAPALLSAAGGIAAVAAMAAIWPASLPFLPVVAVFYGFELVLLGYGSITRARGWRGPSRAAT